MSERTSRKEQEAAMSWKMKSVLSPEPEAPGLGTRHRPGRRCRWVQARLWPFVECELPAAERTAIAAHLPACPACARRHASTVRARASLAPAPAPGSDVTSALAAAITRRLAERGTLRPVGAGRGRAALAAASAVRISLWGTTAALAGWLLAALIPGPALPHPASAVPQQLHRRVAATPPPALTEIGKESAKPAREPRTSPLPQHWGRGTGGEGVHHRSASTQHSPLRTSHAPRRAPRSTEAPQQPERLPLPLYSPTPQAEQNAPTMLVREVAESAPSFAYARSVLPAADGECATIVEVTREQRRPDDPVQVTLMLAGAASAGETGKELLP